MNGPLRYMAKIKTTHLLLMLLFVFASIVMTIAPLGGMQVARAADLTEAQKAECYNKFNGKDIVSSQLSIADQTLYNACRGAAYCTDAGPGSIIDSRKISCPNPNAVDEETTNKANEAETAPLVKLACGTAPAGEAAQTIYLNCTKRVKEIYASCSSTGGGITSESQASAADTARCATPQINAVSGASKVKAGDVQKAIETGRDDRTKVIEEAATAKTKKSCQEEGGTWADGKCTPKEEAEKVLCSGGALGWIMCPLAEIASNLTTELAKFISGIMTFSPLLNSVQGQAIQKVWQVIVNIANILLVIAFLFLVFSQATSVGLSNYGVKKMLPKIIAAAILMNLSFFICAVGVDVANIMGQSVAGIIQAGMDVLPAPPSGVYDGDIKSGSDSGDIAMFTLISGLGLAGLIVTGNIFLVLPILVSAAVAMFTAFAVIMFRQIALVIMIILAPLAFVAWVLPNTESWFEKWRKFFVSLLLMFPLIMIIFYGATFLSRIILITLDPSKGWADVNMVKIMALAVLVLPLFAMPFIMKAAGGILERFGAWTNNRNKGIIDRTRNKANEMKGNTRWAGAMAHRKSMREYNAVMRRGKTPGSINRIMGGKTYVDSARRRAAGLEQKEDFEGIKDARAQQAHLKNSELALIASGQKKFKDSEGNMQDVTAYGRVAAAQKILESGNFTERAMIYDSVAAAGTEDFKKQKLFREQVSEGMFKRGDTAALHPGFGGKILTGENRGRQGRMEAVGQSIAEGRITAPALVHDASMTKDVLEVMQNPSQYGIDLNNPEHADKYNKLSQVAYEALHNPETSQKASAPAFNAPLTQLAAGYTPSTTQASAPLQSGQTATQGGLVIPRGANTASPPQPPSSPSATQQQRQSGGNFGGFNTPPSNAPPAPLRPEDMTPDQRRDYDDGMRR